MIDTDMQPSTLDIDQIVRVVMQRLAAGRDLMEGVAEMAQPTAEPSELVIRDRVVTTHLVEEHLNGKRSLRVDSRAVVTPAVLDLLRSRKIELVRDSRPRAQAAGEAGRAQGAKSPASSATATSTGTSAPATSATATSAPGMSTAAQIAPVLVCGSAVWFNSLTRHLCPQQATVQACDDDAAVPLVERHLSGGGQRAVWLTSRSFAAAATAQRSTKAVCVQLASLADLSAALEQAGPQLLIVDAPRWTVAAIGNLVRTLARSR